MLKNNLHHTVVSQCLFSVLLLFLMWFQSTQNLAQISDLQAQLEEALKEKQDIQEKVSPGLRPLMSQ